MWPQQDLSGWRSFWSGAIRIVSVGGGQLLLDKAGSDGRKVNLS